MLWYEIIALTICIGTLFFGIQIIFKYSNKKKLNEEQLTQLNKVFKQIQAPHNTPKEKIIGYDTLYHKILLALGYQGTFGDILKKEPNEVGDLDKLWELHKLRNKLVHDFDLLTISVLKKKAKEYEKQVAFILK